MHADHDMIGMQIPGTGAGVGAPLVSHKGACCVSRGDVCVLAHSRCPSTGVAKVAFTGSVATGARIMGMCAPDVRAVSLELGGKSPVLVFPDADIDKAVEWVAFGCFWTNGTVSRVVSRVWLGVPVFQLGTRGSIADCQ